MTGGWYRKCYYYEVYCRHGSELGGSGTKWLQSDGTEAKCKYDEHLSSREVCPDYYNKCLENVEEIQ